MPTPPSITTRLLRLIVEHASISQSDLKVRSSLSMSAVSQATNKLLNKGIIRELGLRKVSMGRPKTLLGINPDFTCVIGVQLNTERNLIVMTDLAGTLIGEQQISIGKLTPKQLGDALAKFMKSTASHRHIGAIGLAISGVVDPDSGRCLRSFLLDWNNVDIASQLTERFSIPVFIENDANALALASVVFGQIGQSSSAILATFGQGIGAGIIINRQLYRGRHGNAGEIGNGLLGDGSEKELESVASSRAILQYLLNHDPDIDKRNPPRTLQELELNPSPMAIETLTNAGHHLGVSLANLSIAFDPDIVYLTTEPQTVSRILFDQVLQSFQKYRLRVTPQVTPLHFLTESRMWAQGAAGFAVNRLLDMLASEIDNEKQVN
ncbi:ROK family transcriptional regulator [Vibrio spartinae]|uniref:N-acetylglucosamine repressor n=1 Tax=Vibrio spartinae TaxID=1918945 RepID=A0A1N6M0G0_9VIBR|nr:ROK family transcriptional regulator [Vibrio spartinae]QMV15612.1 N-acetylglucosamine repressor [Vibrio spartinae]SIO92856.1 N-acetylglucosamine repressor [Vibrio spartinae]